MLARLRDFLLIYHSLLKDKRTPARTKILPIVAVLYALFPFDIIPDFLPLLGQVDDVTAIVILLWIAIHAVSTPLYNEHKKRVYKDAIDVPPSS